MPNAITTRSMANSNAEPQNEVLSLLRKISEDNDKLHREVAYISSDIVRLQKSMTTRIDSIQTRLGDHFDDALETIPEMISREISHQCKTLRSDIAVLHHALDASQIIRSLGKEPGFAPFSRLPLEIRLEIWKLACFNNPAVIKIHTRPSSSNRFLGFRCSGYKIPGVLHTSRESRHHALKFYTKESVDIQHCPDADSDDIEMPVEMAVRPKYFNYDVDVFCPVLDSHWINMFGENTSWAEVIHDNDCLHGFRRVAVSDPLLRGLRVLDADFLLKPTSGIDEIILLIPTTRSVESNTRLRLVPTRGNGLLPWNFNDPPPDADDYVGSYIIAENVIKKITKALTRLAASRNGEDDAAAGEDEEALLVADNWDSPDSLEAEKDAARNAAIKKLLPDFTIMRLIDADPPLLNVGISMG